MYNLKTAAIVWLPFFMDFIEKRKVVRTAEFLALMEAASFCEAFKRTKDTADSRNSY